jgi:hypothetical protein
LFKQINTFVAVKAATSTAAVLVRGNTTEAKEAQPAKAEAPIVVTAAGRATDSRPLLANALAPIVVSELGR